MSRAKLVASLLKKTILIFFIKNVLVYLGCVHTGFPGCSERELLFLAEPGSRAQARECGSRAPERAFCSRGTWGLLGQGRACAPCTGRQKSLATARHGSPNTHFLTRAHQAPPPLGFSRQEHWSGLPLPAPVMPTSPYLKVPKVYDLATASVNKVLLKTATLIASILVVVAFTLF